MPFLNCADVRRLLLAMRAGGAFSVGSEDEIRREPNVSGSGQDGFSKRDQAANVAQAMVQQGATLLLEPWMATCVRDVCVNLVRPRNIIRGQTTVEMADATSASTVWR